MNELSTRLSSRQALEQIFETQLSGKFQEAHDAYISFFEENDIDDAALKMFAVCCMSLGRFDKAKGLLQHIVTHAPMITEAFFHLAECHLELGEPAEALEVLSNQPSGQDEGYQSHLLASRAYVLLEKSDKAIKSLKSAQKGAPHLAEISLAIASIQTSCGEFDAAEATYRDYLFSKPDNTEALVGQSEVFFARQKWESVLVNTSIVLKSHPDHFRARFLQCLALFKLKKYRDLLTSAKILADTAPENAKALEILSQAYIENRDNHAALMASLRLLEIVPDHLEGLQVKACAYFRLGQNEQALAANEDILDVYPDNMMAMENKGILLERLRRVDEALMAYDKVLEYHPDSASAKFNKSISLLLKGNLDDGFELYEHRLNKDDNLIHDYLGDEPIWDGKASLSGKHLLIHPEQGLGDTLMFCRYIRYLEDVGAKLTFAVQPTLRSMIESLDQPASLISVGESVKGIDFHIPLMSVAKITFKEWQSQPPVVPYLRVPDKKLALWTERLGEKTKPRIGFVCGGNPLHQNDSGRSMNMARLLEALPDGPSYHVLQKEFRDVDEAAIKGRPDVARHDHEIEDFSDTAALCANMDLVISVDTSVAHLAGAIGQRTLVMLAWWPDWRWTLQGASTMWYPNMELVRQDRPRDWNNVLRQVSFAIQARCKSA
ncbi:MAG: hypothetical protein CBB97_25125 [Candidatus Endolissoclinum sp. TMED37]|nr:MAG: hypothetical protein CBB97_25125 [Candidatus Endolissoclinum sp. TMED37]